MEKSGRLSLGHSGDLKNGSTTGDSAGAPEGKSTIASLRLSPPRAEIPAVVPHIDIVAEDNFDKAIREHEEIMQREHDEKTKEVYATEEDGHGDQAFPATSNVTGAIGVPSVEPAGETSEEDTQWPILKAALSDCPPSIGPLRGKRWFEHGPSLARAAPIATATRSQNASFGGNPKVVGQFCASYSQIGSPASPPGSTQAQGGGSMADSVAAMP